MRPIIKSRTVFYEFGDGRNGSIKITFSFDGNEEITLEETPITWIHAHAVMESDWYTSSVRTMGTDELQVICRLMKIAGSALIGACNHAGAILYTVVPTHPVEDPYDVFFK